MKNMVGKVGKHMGSGCYINMAELHSSSSQLLMIVEASDIYISASLALDGLDANRRSAASRSSRFEREQVFPHKGDMC